MGIVPYCAGAPYPSLGTGSPYIGSGSRGPNNAVSPRCTTSPASDQASNAPFAPSFSGAENVTPLPTAFAWASTSEDGPSHVPTRHASKDPSTPPTASPTTNGTPPRRRQRNTTSALTKPKASASRVNVPSTPTACSPSVSLRYTTQLPCSSTSPTSGTCGASHHHSTPSSVPRTATATVTAKASSSSVFMPGPSCPYRGSAGAVYRGSGACHASCEDGSWGGGGGVNGAVTLTSCQARLCGASPDGRPAIRPGGDGKRDHAHAPAHGEVTEHEGPVGMRSEGTGERLDAVGRGQQVPREPHRLGHPLGGQHPEQQRGGHAELSQQGGQFRPGREQPERGTQSREGRTGQRDHRHEHPQMGQRKPEQHTPEHGGHHGPGHGEGGVRPRGAEHHGGRRHRQGGVVIEPAARPQLAEVLREQIERDEGDDQHGRPGDHRPGLAPAVHDPPHQDHDADRLEGRHEQQRDARDPRAGQLRPVHGRQRRPQPRARPELGGPVPARLPDGRRAARQNLGRYDTHVALLLFAPAVALCRTDTAVRVLKALKSSPAPAARPRPARGTRPPGWVWR